MLTSNPIPMAKIDTAAEPKYNENDVRQIAQEAAQQAVSDLLNRLMSGSAMLDNEKQPSVEKPCEEDSNMASNYCKYYTYIDTNGNQKTKRLYGANEKETDLKYQEFLRDLFLL